VPSLPNKIITTSIMAAEREWGRGRVAPATVHLPNQREQVLRAGAVAA
jgi:hypothetical protein